VNLAGLEERSPTRNTSGASSRLLEHPPDRTRRLRRPEQSGNRRQGSGLCVGGRTGALGAGPADADVVEFSSVFAGSLIYNNLVT
jgi:hypothetical protein